MFILDNSNYNYNTYNSLPICSKSVEMCLTCLQFCSETQIQDDRILKEEKLRQRQVIIMNINQTKRSI